jgi:hypothetical protein
MIGDHAQAAHLRPARRVGPQLSDSAGLQRRQRDFSRWLGGEVFQPLGNKREFKHFFVAGGTVCWANGADIAPETLRAAPDA